MKSGRQNDKRALLDRAAPLCLSDFMRFILISLGIFIACSFPVYAQENLEQVDSVIASSTPIAVAFMLSMLVLKVTAFVIGYLIVKLGHDTMIKGVTGEFDFGFSGSGVQTKLKSASPGVFFILMGAAIIIWGLTVEKPFTVEVPQSPQEQQQQMKQDDTAAGSNAIRRPVVPD